MFDQLALQGITSIAKAYNITDDINEECNNIDISKEYINEYFNILRQYSERYYGKKNELFINFYNAVALNEEWATAITDDYISAYVLKSSALPMEIELIQTVGKDALLYIVKNMVNRDFANIAYDLSINYELCNDRDTQRAMLNLNPIIRRKIKKNMQDSLEFTEKLAKAGEDLAKS